MGLLSRRNWDSVGGVCKDHSAFVADLAQWAFSTFEVIFVRNCLDLACVRAGYVGNNIALSFLFLLYGGAVEYFIIKIW